MDQYEIVLPSNLKGRPGSVVGYLNNQDVFILGFGYLNGSNIRVAVVGNRGQLMKLKTPIASDFIALFRNQRCSVHNFLNNRDQLALPIRLDQEIIQAATDDLVNMKNIKLQMTELTNLMSFMTLDQLVRLRNNAQQILDDPEPEVHLELEREFERREEHIHG